VAGARDRDAREGRETLGHRRVAAAPTRTWPSTTTQEMPGMSPRAMAVSASAASGCRRRVRTRPDSAGRRRRSSGAGREAKRARVVAGGEGDHDFRREIAERGDLADALDDARGITPVPVGVSLAMHTRARASASARPLHDVEGRAEVPGLDDLQRHRRLGDDRSIPASSSDVVRR